MISDALSGILRAERNGFNARFAEARYIHPNLNGDDFAAFLADTLDPLIVAVAAVQPNAVHDATCTAYDAGLELVGQQLAGPKAKLRHIEEGWQSLLVAAAERVCEAPERVIAATSNALHNLETTGAARPDFWIAELKRLTPSCPDTETWLRAGQVLAWRAGLACYRESALAVADTVPEHLANEAVGGVPDSDWSNVRARLEVDPWFDPSVTPASSAPRATPDLRVAKRVGSFRGFGGLFAEPPTVATRDGQIVAHSAGEAWTVFADCFGATFHRAATVGAGEPRLDCGSHISVSGTTVTLGESTLELPELGRFTSAARTEHTLALTGQLSHALVLVALT